MQLNFNGDRLVETSPQYIEFICDRRLPERSCEMSLGCMVAAEMSAVKDIEEVCPEPSADSLTQDREILQHRDVLVEYVQPRTLGR